jgi:hypothetical protein
MLKSAFAVIALLSLPAAALCQQKTGAKTAPIASAVVKPEQTSVMYGDCMFIVRYTPPSVNGRKIFGGVVPYGKVWAIGETAPVTLHAEADMQFGDFSLFKGDYSVYILPDNDSWHLIFNRQTGAKAIAYDPSQDIGRIKMTVAKSASSVETCAITLTKTGELAGKLQLAWENTTATVPFYLDRAAIDKEW